MGDVSGLSRAEIWERHRAVYGVESQSAEQMLWAFYNEIEIGDIIVARRGRLFSIGVGHVLKEAYFDLRRGYERLNGLLSPFVGANFIDVQWDRLDVVPVREWFTIKTVANIGEAKYRRLFER